MMKCTNCGAENPDEAVYCKECGASFNSGNKTVILDNSTKYMGDPLSFSPGEKFGDRYQIIEEIGEGGMGKVFKARDNELNIVVALKMIKPQLSANPDIVSRFKRELLLAREILHEHVIRIHDLGEVAGIKYISMNYIEGNSLQEIIQATGKLTIEKTIDITKQVCGALTAAHEKGIVHRDLKPQNIMIDKHGKGYVLDFGIARSIDGKLDAGATQEGIVLGTPHYMSPEQIKGDKVDAGTDIYSLGIMMYEMVTGKPPFTADNPMALLHLHLNEKPESPSKLNPQTPPKLERIILKCIEKKRKNRYQAVTEVTTNLEQDKTIQIPPLKITDKKEGGAGKGFLKFILRIFILLLVIYAAISVSSLINDSTYLNKIEKVKLQFDNHYKEIFPIQKDWLPGEWETKDTNGWVIYMELFAPNQPEKELETLTNRLREAVKCSKLDSMAELQSDRMLYLPMVLKYADMLPLEARSDFLQGNYEEGLSKLYNFAVFSIDLFTASTRLPEALAALDCFHKIYRELIPLLLNRELFKDSLSPYETGSLTAFGEIVEKKRPETIDFASPPVREEDIEAVMTLLQSFEKLTEAALDKFEPKVVLEKEYLRLGKNADTIFDSLGVKKSDYHIYGKLFYWNQFFSINRYYYRKGIAFYDGLFDRMEYTSSMYDKSKLIKGYYKENAGSYGGGALVADGPHLASALTTSRTFAKLVSVIFTINRFGVESKEFLNLKGTPLFDDELSGNKFEITEAESGFAIRLYQGVQDVTLALKKRDYRQGHKDILNSFKPFDLKTETHIQPFFESR